MTSNREQYFSTIHSEMVSQVRGLLTPGPGALEVEKVFMECCKQKFALQYVRFS